MSAHWIEIPTKNTARIWKQWLNSFNGPQDINVMLFFHFLPFSLLLHHEVKTTFLSTWHKRFFPQFLYTFSFQFFFQDLNFALVLLTFFISYLGILVNFLLVSHTVCFIFTMRALHTFKTIRNGKCKFFLFHRIFFFNRKKMYEMNEAKTNILKHNTIYDIFLLPNECSGENFHRLGYFFFHKLKPFAYMLCWMLPVTLAKWKKQLFTI